MPEKIPLSTRAAMATSALLGGTRLGNAFNALLINRYEAAIPCSPDRPYLPALVRDARYDATSFSRWEIARKVRYFFRNTWLLPRLQEEDVKYTVGGGLQIEAATSDPEFNKILMEDYQNFCEAPFRDSNLSMNQGHRMAAKETHMDGEVFENCTYLKMNGKPARPVIEQIESHRVSSPGGDYEYPADGQNVIDGVQLNRDVNGQLIGRPAGFHVRTGVEGTEWKMRPAFDFDNPGAGGMIHIYDPERIGMYRAISAYAPIINETADLILLAALEMDKAKGNAAINGIFKTWNGEVPTTFQGRFGVSGATASPGGMPVPGGIDDKYIDDQIKRFQKVISGRFIGMKPMEELDIKSNPSPSAAQQWLWTLTIHKICATRNIPKILVLHDGDVGGAGVRAVLDDANISFMARFQIQARAARFKYLFFAAWAIHNNPRLKNPPADWKKCKISPPRACNVDVGRTAVSNALDIATGVKSWDDVTAPDGATAKHRHHRKAINIMEAQESANEVNKSRGLPEIPLQPVTFEQIIQPMADVAEIIAQAALFDAQAEAADKGEQAKPTNE